MNISKMLAICGMLSPILYTLLWILGGVLVPGYSHIRDDVSSLIAVDAYRRSLFQSFIIISSSLLLIFFIGLHWGVNNGNGSIVGPVLFIISSFIGVLVAIFFPLDAGGEITSLKGKMHLILIVVSGVLIIGAMVLMFFRLRLTDGWRGFAIYSLVSAPVTLILVIVMGFFTGSEYMGLVERFMVSKYQLYYFITGLMVFLRN
ncbi:MAG: DUF998 domain-containing protein [Spirochaetota bacterium]|nr:MAG: DUF998 domain-containing protein [Spirochaetota bacterium]